MGVEAAALLLKNIGSWNGGIFWSLALQMASFTYLYSVPWMLQWHLLKGVRALGPEGRGTLSSLIPFSRQHTKLCCAGVFKYQLSLRWTSNVFIFFTSIAFQYFHLYVWFILRTSYSGRWGTFIVNCTSLPFLLSTYPTYVFAPIYTLARLVVLLNIAAACLYFMYCTYFISVGIVTFIVQWGQWWKNINLPFEEHITIGMWGLRSQNYYMIIKCHITD